MRISKIIDNKKLKIKIIKNFCLKLLIKQKYIDK